MVYNEDVCKEKHKQIQDTLDIHNERLNKHSDRLDILEQDSREYRTEIKNLIKKMDDFMVTINKMGAWHTCHSLNFCCRYFIKEIKLH